jgi:hypothetical protein
MKESSSMTVGSHASGL